MCSLAGSLLQRLFCRGCISWPACRRGLLLVFPSVGPRRCILAYLPQASCTHRPEGVPAVLSAQAWWLAHGALSPSCKLPPAGSNGRLPWPCVAQASLWYLSMRCGKGLPEFFAARPRRRPPAVPFQPDASAVPLCACLQDGRISYREFCDMLRKYPCD